MAEDSLLREIDEALQQERWHQLWKRYGSRILYSCAAIVVIMGGLIVWQQRSTYIAQENTKALMSARDRFIDGAFDQAAIDFAALADKSSGAHRVLALLWMAKSHLAGEQQAEAVEALAKASAESKPQALVKLACVQGKMLAPKDARFDGCLPEKDMAFHGFAAELNAAQAAATQDFDKALAALPEGRLPMTQQRRIDDIKAYAQSAKHQK